MKLIFAQGNPEPDYTASRHNVGFSILNFLAKDLGAKWTDKPKFNAIIAETKISGEKVLFVKPTSYYNETGAPIRKLIDFYKLESVSDVLVIHDDLALPFGTIRVRKQGSDGGNNGIKSINSQIGQDYTRVRIGTHNELREKMDDANFVLSKFSGDEAEKLKNNIIPQAVTLINQFCSNNIDSASYSTIESV